MAKFRTSTVPEEGFVSGAAPLKVIGGGGGGGGGVGGRQSRQAGPGRGGSRRPLSTPSPVKSVAASAPLAQWRNEVRAENDAVKMGKLLPKILEGKQLFLYGGFGRRSTGGKALWHACVSIRECYNLSPAVDKASIEEYKGCNYYSDEVIGWVGAGEEMRWREYPVDRPGKGSNADVILPQGRTGHVFVHLGDFDFLVFGGQNVQERNSPMIAGAVIYSVSTHRWSKVEARGCPEPRTGASAVVHDGRVYVFGGYLSNGFITDELCIFDIASRSWMLHPPQAQGDYPPPLAWHSANVLGGTMYIFGGHRPTADGSALFCSSEVFALRLGDALEWSTLVVSGHCPSARARHASCVMDTRLCIFGGESLGYQGQRALLDDTFVLNVRDSSWAPIRAAGVPPTPRDDATLFSPKSDILVVIGGWTGEYNAEVPEVQPWTASIHVLDIESQRWNTIPQRHFGTPRYGARLVLVDDGTGPTQCRAGVPVEIPFEVSESSVKALPHIVAISRGLKLAAQAPAPAGDAAGGAPDIMAEIFRDGKQKRLNAALFSCLDPQTNQGEDAEEVLDEVSDLIAAGAAVNGTDEGGFTPVMTVVRSSPSRWSQQEAARILRALFARGAEVDTRDPAGHTALFFAAAQGTHELVRLLAQHGASPAAVAHDGSTVANHALDPVACKMALKEGREHPVDFQARSSLEHHAPHSQNGPASPSPPDRSRSAPHPQGSGGEAGSPIRPHTSTPARRPAGVGQPASSHPSSGAGFHDARARVPWVLVQPWDRPALSIAEENDLLAIQTKTPFTVVGSARKGYKLRLIMTETGAFAVDFLYGRTSLLRDRVPLKVVVAPGEINPLRSELHGPGLKTATAGSEASFTFTALDAFGNRLPKGKHRVAAQLVGPESVFCDIVDNDDGIYHITYTPSKKGHYRVIVEVEDVKITGDEGIPIYVYPGPTRSSECRVGLSGPQFCTAGNFGSFVITAYDVFGNRRETGGDVITCLGSGPVPLQCDVMDMRDGTYTFQYRGVRVGTYEIRIRAEGAFLRRDKCYVIVEPGPPSARTSYLASALGGAPGATAEESGDTRVDHNAVIEGVAGEPVLLYLRSMDEYGNCTRVGGAEVTGRLTPVAPPPEKQRRSTSIASVQLHSGLGSSALDSRPAPRAVGATIGSSVSRRNMLAVEESQQLSRLRPVAREIPCEVESRGDGTYLIRFVPTIAEKYVLSVELDGVPVPDLPTVVVEAASTDESCCKVYGEGLVDCHVGLTTEFHVRTFDRFQNLVTARSKVTATVQGPEIVSCDVSYDERGCYTCSYIATMVGQYYIQVKVNGAPVSYLSRISVSAGMPNASKCKLEGEGLQRCRCGETGRFTLQLIDSFGNPVFASSEFPVTSSIKGPESLPVTVTDELNGHYTFAYQPFRAGFYRIIVKLGNSFVNSQPIRIEAAAGPAYAKNCTVRPDAHSNPTQAVAGNVYALSLVTADLYKNERSDNGPPGFCRVSASLKGPAEQQPGGGEVIDCQVRDHNDGIVLLSAVPKIVGTYRLEILVNDELVETPNIPQVLVRHGKMVATRCEVSGDGLKGCVAGQRATFQLTARDFFGNTVSTPAPNAIRATVTSLSTRQECLASVFHESGCVYGLTYDVEVAGEISFAVYVYDELVPGCKDHVGVVIPGPTEVSKFVAQGEGLHKAVAGVPASFNLLASDAFGNHRLTSEDPLLVTCTDLEARNCELVRCGDGKYTVKYTIVRSGRKELNVLMQGVPLPHFPTVVTVAPGPCDPALCVAKGAGLAGGVVNQPINYRFHLKDQHGNPCITGGPVVEAHFEGPGKVAPRIKDCLNGDFIITYVATMPGEYVLTHTVNGSQVPEKHRLAIIADVASLAKSTVEGAGITKSVVGESTKFVLHLRDGNGVQLKSGGDKVKIEAKSVSNPQQILKFTMFDQNDGTYFFSYVPEHAGVYEAVITVNGSRLRPDPYQIHVSEPHTVNKKN